MAGPAPDDDAASCPSLAYLQPRLAFAAPDDDGALPGLALPGAMLGPAAANGTAGGVTRVQQDGVVFSSAALAAGSGSAQLVASVGAASGAIRLPGVVQLTVQP